MKVIKCKWFIPFLMLPFSMSLEGQNVMTSSPYSMFGIGELVHMNGTNVGMGSVSTAMRGKKLINMDNPAGLSGVDSCRLLAEISAYAQYETYASRGNHNKALTGNFAGLSLAGRILPRWYAGAGLTPYSVVGYHFQTEQEVEGAPGNYYTSTFKGEGGFSKFHVSNAFLLHPSLSIGLNVGYIFGHMTCEEAQSEMSVSDEMDGNAWAFDWGVQYMRRLHEDVNLVLGATYSFATKMKFSKERTLTSNLYESSLEKNHVNQYLPQKFSVGASLEYPKTTYALDYLFTRYSRLESADNRILFVDSHELRAGFCFHPSGYSSQSVWKRMDYKLGACLSWPYCIRIKGQRGAAWRATAGLGFPLSTGQLNVSFYYDRLSYPGGAFQRGEAGLTVSITLSELFYHARL